MFDEKIENLALSCIIWLSPARRQHGAEHILASYRAGLYRRCVDQFAEMFRHTSNLYVSYHFGLQFGTLENCFKNFERIRATSQKLKLADILYEKGFDEVDLLMLADEVEDEEIASALSSQYMFHHGFWALDVLRTKGL